MFFEIVMVFGFVSSEGDMKPHVLDLDGHVNLLEIVVKLWLERVAAERLYVEKQDSVSYHTSGERVQNSR